MNKSLLKQKAVIIFFLIFLSVITFGQPDFSCFKLYKVTFTAKSGKIHVIKSDFSSIDYNAPQWFDSDLNSLLNGDDDRDYPICYTKGSVMAIKAEFKIVPAQPFPSGYKIKIKAECSCDEGFSYTLKEKEVSVVNDGVVYDVEEAVGKVPDKIFMFKKLKIQWKFSYDDGQSWSTLTNSDHRVYFINKNDYADIRIGSKTEKPILHYTSVHIGCLNAMNQTDDKVIVDKIFSEFTDRSVTRVDGILNLGYWRGNPIEGPFRFQAAGLLRYLNETCGGWAHFFASIIAIQGIESDVIGIYTYDESRKLQAIPMDARRKIASLGSDYQVKKWKQLGGPDIEANYYFYVKNWNIIKSSVFAGDEAIDLEGVPGQGNADPRSFFENHAMVKYKNSYYDPSYGAIISNDRSKDQARWEDDNLEAFGTLITKISTGQDFFWVYKKNIVGRNETYFSK